MSDLTDFRDHCRRMAGLTEPVTQRVWVQGLHGGLPGWGTQVVHDVPSDADRALWSRLADEIDTHIARCESTSYSSRSGATFPQVSGGVHIKEAPLW